MQWRDEKKLIIRRRILRKAQELFLAEGVEATSVEEIARAAGISRASLFNYFRGKRAILDAMTEALEPRMVQLVQHYVGKDLSTEQRLLQLFAHSARVVEQSGELNRQLFVQGSAVDGFPALHRALVELLEIGREQGDVSASLQLEMAAESVYFSFVAGLLGWLSDSESDLSIQFTHRARHLCVTLGVRIDHTQ